MKKVNINKDELYDLYINKNLGVNEIASIYDVTNKVIRRNLKEYDIEKSEELYKEYKDRVARQRSETCSQKYGGVGFASPELSEKTKQTMLSKYGSKDLGFKNSTIQNKAQQTILERYKVTAISKNSEIKEKINNTTIEHYGCKRAMMLPSINQQAIKTRNERYTNNELNLKRSYTYYNKTGFEYPSQNPVVKKIVQEKVKLKRDEINNKIRQTILDKYNIDHVSKIHYDNNTRNILENKENLYNFITSLSSDQRDVYYISTLLGVHYTTLFKYLREYNLISYVNNDGSSFEKDVRSFLDGLNVYYEVRNRKIIKPYEIDIYIPDKNVAIECNGTYWHSYLCNKDKKYHYNKSKQCEERGIRLIHIWEYEWKDERQRPILKNIIQNALGVNVNKVYARKLDIEIKPSNMMKDFFNQNNIQGFRPGKFSICLVDKQTREIYMAYMMGNAFFGKGKYEWEVIRGATKLGYTVVGGASKIWKYFIETYNPNSCVYYIDYNYFNGNSLKNLPHMQYIKTQPSFKNWFVNENVVKNRDPQHHKEISLKYQSNEVIPIYNAGTKVYVWMK